MKIDWIQGDKFRDMAKWTYSPNEKAPRDDYDNLPNTLDLSALRDGDIIYTHMMYVKQLFAILKYFSKKFILVTHSCDCSIEEYGMRRPDGKANTHDLYYFELPDNLIKWYSKNVNYKHPLIESIPIGVENDRWHKTIPKLDLMIVQMKRYRGSRNLVYMNHNIKTNPGVRKPLYEMFGKKKWVTAMYGGNGVKFERYLHLLFNHKFIICPEGNGIDTIRTWEALYMGTIPIEKRNINNQFYTDLPICFVDDWDEITEDFLIEEYQRIKSATWNMDKLQFKYWKKKIQNT